MPDIKPSKYLLLLFILFFNNHGYCQETLASTVNIEKTTILEESFIDNSNNWILNNAWIKGKLEEGSYTIKCKNYKGANGLSYIPVPIDTMDSFVLEVQFKIDKGNGGLVFGQNSSFDHYRMELGEKNSLLLLKDTPSKKATLEIVESLKVPDNTEINEYNKLTIEKAGSLFSFYLNDSLLGQNSDISLMGNYVGFSVGLNSGISVDYLNLHSIKESNVPLLANSDVNSADKFQKPDIEWVSPSRENTTVEAYSVKVRARITSHSGLKDAYFYVNGVASKGEPEIRQIEDEPGVFQIEKNIDFIPGQNSVYILATNQDGSTKSEQRNFTIPSATLPSISWQKPSEDAAAVNVDIINIEVGIQSLTNLKSVKAFVNGIPQPEQNIMKDARSGQEDYSWKGSVILKEGENDIYVMATNIAGTTTSEKRTIKYDPNLKEKRLALVFGNAEYGTKTNLKNPVNDANLMEANLRMMGFDVIKRTNSGKAEMEEALKEFNTKLADYDVALLYYAGHGVQVDGVNYILPVDAKLEEKVHCQWEAISMTDVVRQFEKHPDNINIVIMDACRNNPFKSWVRGDEAGFKFLPNVSGTIIGYATAEGATAADGDGANGVYTEELVKQMMIPQPVESVFKRARVQVELRTNGMQSPQETTGLRGDFYFVK